MAAPLVKLEGVDIVSDTSNLMYPLDLESEQHGYIVRFISTERTPQVLASGKDGSKPSLTYTSYDIKLHVPSAPTATYSTNWEGGSTGMMGEGINRNLLTGDIDDLTSQLKDNLEKSAKQKGLYAGLKAAASVTPELANAAQVNMGITSNDNLKLMFKGVNLRSFSFEYNFLPKNKSEAQEVASIIKAFKYNMMPNVKKDSGLFEYPNEWNISYINPYSDKGSLYLHKFLPAALTDMSVNYGGEGVFATLKNGEPVSTTLSLTFQETTFLTKETAENY